MTRIVIEKPPSPIPLISRPARKWLPRDRWGSQTEEVRPAATLGEPDSIHDTPEAFDRFIRRFLFWKEVQ